MEIEEMMPTVAGEVLLLSGEGERIAETAEVADVATKETGEREG